jgi:hypothetical protein
MTRSVVVAAVVSATLAAACDRLLQLTVVPSPDAAHGSDGPGPDAPRDALADARGICFMDGFSAISVATWDPFNGSGGATVSSNGSQLVVDVPASSNAAGYAGLNYGPASLADMATSIEVVQAATLVGVTTELNWYTDTGTNSYVMYEEAMTLFVTVTFNGGTSLLLSQIAYDPVAHRFWRIRHSSQMGKIYFETSPDASTWTELYSEAPRLPTTGLDVEIECGAYTATSTAQQCLFDNFVLSGPC